MARLSISIWILCVLTGFSALAQNRNGVDDFLNSVGEGASVGLEVIDLSSQTTVVSYCPELQLTPASLTKLITTASAIRLLGSDFRFRTSVYASGVVAGGTCTGDLVVVGGGDPSLGSSLFASSRSDVVFNKISSAILSRGISSFNGDLVIDLSYCPVMPYPAGRSWDDLGNYYGALPAALSYRENTFSLLLDAPVTVGHRCSVVGTEPELPDVVFDCWAVAGSKHDSAYIYGVPGSTFMQVQGAIPPGSRKFRVKGALPSPPALFARELRSALQARGIAVGGRIRIVNQSYPVQVSNCLCTIDSPSLSQMIAVINGRSHNLLADHLLLALAPAVPAGSWWDAATNLVSKYWVEQQVDGAARWKLYDGSGLSVFSLLSVRSLNELLSNMHHSDDADLFQSSLAVGGVSGTLRNLWTDDAVRGRVYAKSGSMTGVIGYAGYFKTHKGSMCAFSVIVNHSTASAPIVRKSIEKLVSQWILSL